MLEFNINRAKESGRIPTIHIPDGVAMTAAINPSIFKLEKHYVTCVTEGGNVQGWSIMAWGSSNSI